MSSPTKLSEQLAAEISQVVGDHKLNHIEDVVEKQVLPSASDIENEKKLQKFNEELETFDSKSLKKVETEEKVLLPTAEEIEAEKRLSTS